MIRKVSLAISIFLLVLLGGALAIHAQEDSGTISGTVYRTENPNSTCTEGGLPGEPGVPLQFVNRDNQTTINQNSTSNGSYLFTALNEGTWQVTVNPGAGWRVLSQQTRQVEITENNPDHENINFCIIRVTTPTPTTAPPVLPESGAPVAPTLLLAAGLGVLFLLAGAGLFVYGRR